MSISTNNPASYIMPDSNVTINSKYESLFRVTGSAVYASDYLKSLNEKDTIDIVIPSTIDGIHITEIGKEAFAYCDAIASVDIKSDIRLISEYAFNNCGSLRSVIIPDSIFRIDRIAFSNCYNIKFIINKPKDSIPGYPWNVDNTYSVEWLG